MLKKVFIPGLLGAVVFVLWALVVDAVLGLNSRINMKQVPNERVVYEVLKAHIVEAGRYVCNPALSSEGRFPDGEPAFGIQYAGIGHEAAYIEVILGLFIFLAAPIIGVWMLSVTSDRFNSRYANRLFFFTAIGLLLAVFGDLKAFGIGGHALTHALILAARTIIAWTLAGMVVAWRLRPLSSGTAKS